MERTRERALRENGLSTHPHAPPMRARLLTLLLAPLLLAGCTFGRGGESTENVDKSDYTGGGGVALAIRNDAKDEFHYTIRVLAAGDREAAALTGNLEPGQSVEKWWSLDRTTYSVRMNYTWTGAGAASHGQDERTIDLNDCPQVTRLAWTLQQMQGQVGSAFPGVACVADESDAP